MWSILVHATIGTFQYLIAPDGQNHRSLLDITIPFHYLTRRFDVLTYHAGLLFVVNYNYDVTQLLRWIIEKTVAFNITYY